MRSPLLRFSSPVVLAGLVLMGCGGSAPEAEAPNPSAPEGTEVPAGEVRAMSGPIASILCLRPEFGGVDCTGSATGGTPPYRYYWGRQVYHYEGSVHHTLPGSLGGSTRNYPCYAPSDEWPATYEILPTLFVRDAAGVQSSTVSDSWQACQP
ncbi:hypothetical protein [Myxococcus stipitatus]|nr:hypothetical protein [Myxococcus stipitatus]